MTGIDQQDLMVVITPVPDYQVQIIPTENETRVTVAPREVRAVNDLSSYVSRAQFAETATTASFAQSVSGSIDSASFADTAGRVVFAHESGSIVYTGSLLEGVFSVSDTVYSVPTASYSAALVEYVAERADGIRVGQVMATWLNGTIKFTDISTTDIGDADDISFNVVLNGENANFRVTSLGIGAGGWTVQALFKLFPRLV